MKYDVFISHASEDNATVAKPLHAALKKAGLSVWIDEHELTLGDSLLKKIDDGLKKSRFGVVILSRTFFDKFWPRGELQALMAKQEYTKTILPVRHEINRRELVRLSPILAGLVDSSTEAGLEVVVKEIAAAVGKARKGTTDGTVALDLSHRQGEWNSLVAAARRIIKDDVLELESGIAAHMDDLFNCQVLVMALGYHVEFSRQDVILVRDWVQAGGGLFLLGFYLADGHHEANPSALGRALGFSFRNDIVMPPGRTSRRECQDQGFDTTGEFAVRTSAGNDHPIGRNVQDLAVLSACSIDPINAPEYQIGIPRNAAVVVDVTGRPNQAGYLLQIHEYVQTSRTEPTVLAAWRYGQGRVVAAGTWKFFTLDQGDNIRLIENVIEWLGSPNKRMQPTREKRRPQGGRRGARG
jgi:hypothetical protein